MLVFFLLKNDILKDLKGFSKIRKENFKKISTYILPLFYAVMKCKNQNYSLSLEVFLSMILFDTKNLIFLI